MKLSYEEKDIIKITTLIRAIFSPDTNIRDIEMMFPEIPEEKVNKLSNKVKAIRSEARMLIPTIQRQTQWKRETRHIIRDAVNYFYSR
jgi:hypothetical protein